MEKGKIKIKKNPKSQAEIKSGNGNKFKVRKDFDFTEFRDINNNVELDCEFEYNEAEHKVNKIIINGGKVPFDEEKINAKQKLEKEKEEKKLREQEEKKLVEENKEAIEFHKDDFVKVEKDYVFIPNDTANTLKEKTWQIDNFALKLNKAARFEDGKFQFFKAPYKKDMGFTVKEKFEKLPVSEIAGYNFKAAKNLIGESNLFKIDLKPDWRLAVGLGNENVYETSITLHHIYGIPYIPASSVKGVVRNYIINEYFGNPETCPNFPSDEKDYPLVNAEYRALTTSEMFCKIFGCPKEIKKIVFENSKPKYKVKEGKETNEYKTEEKATPVALLNKEGKPTEHIGEIIFFDAYPLKLDENSIVVDIMNPHYGDYYNDSDNKKGIAPTDYQNPIPVFFLTVANTKFQFIIGSKKAPLSNFKIDGHSIDWWLKQALTNHGIGAKTAVGYGYLKQ